MSEFERQLEWLRRNDHRDHDDVGGLLTVAEGLAEVIALLRPLVDTITAKPEPLKLRTDGTGPMPCLAGDPGSNGFRRCMEPYGHDGDHVHRSRMTGVDYAWAQPPGDVSRLVQCAETQAHGRCVLRASHNGECNNGHEQWMPEVTR